MPFVMNLFINLLAILALFPSIGDREINDSSILGLTSVHEVVPGELLTGSFLNPCDTPPSSESFYECSNESALEEEDSNEIEHHGIAPLTFLDVTSLLPRDLLSSSLPARIYSQFAIIKPILRC